MAVLHVPPSNHGADPEIAYGHPTRFVREPLDTWTDGLSTRAAIGRVMATLAVVMIVAAIFFVAHVVTATL